MLAEGRLICEPYLSHLTIAAFTRNPDQTRRRFKDQLCPRLMHREDACFKQNRCNTHRIGARHGRILCGLKYHETHIRLWVARRQDNVRIVPWSTTRFEEQELANIVEVAFQIDSFFKDC